MITVNVPGLSRGDSVVCCEPKSKPLAPNPCEPEAARQCTDLFAAHINISILHVVKCVLIPSEIKVCKEMNSDIVGGQPAALTRRSRNEVMKYYQHDKGHALPVTNPKIDAGIDITELVLILQSFPTQSHGPMHNTLRPSPHETSKMLAATSTTCNPNPKVRVRSRVRGRVRVKVMLGVTWGWGCWG
jgi:hypothetical protein